jgi:ABC-type Zn uptake system ZnuABC Zn-binding protein ZnuA
MVYTVNYPLQYFAERIGGDRVDVRLPAPADVDPAYWSPGAETVAAYQGADLILLNGAGYAQWVQRASLPRAQRVDFLTVMHRNAAAFEALAVSQRGASRVQNEEPIAEE